MRTYTLIVPDSSPLITLAMAGALDLLLRPGLKIIIPDGVHWEVARDANLAGATDIIDWMKRNPGQVVIYPTQEFANHQTLIAAGVKRVRGLGERCVKSHRSAPLSHVGFKQHPHITRIGDAARLSLRLERGEQRYWQAHV
jgi:hypothetical protein